MQPTHASFSATQPTPSGLLGKTVLVADDSLTLLRALETRCSSLGLRVETASDGRSTLLKLMKEVPDLLILDLDLPDVDGFRIVERLTDSAFPPLPVIVLTGRSDRAAIQRCKELGVLYVYKDGWAALEKAIRKIFLEVPTNSHDRTSDQPSASRPRVLLVDDSPVVLKWLTSALRNYDLELSQASNGMQGFWLTLTAHPDVVVTDYTMEQGSGHYLLHRIKRTPSTQHIPVIVFTGQSLDTGEHRAIGRSPAAAFILKPVDASVLIAELGRHVALTERLSPQ
jgi:CheY-like chemotaxis protein